MYLNGEHSTLLDGTALCCGKRMKGMNEGAAFFHAVLLFTCGP